jgi:hypothetical protein
VLSIGTSSGLPFLRAQWYVLPTLEPVGGGKPLYDTGQALAVEGNDVEDEAPTIGKVEVRASYGGKNQPTTDYVVNAGVTRAERAYNVQVSVATNEPTTKTVITPRLARSLTSVAFIHDLFARGVMETHTMCSELNDGGNPSLLRCHEDTRMHYTASAFVDATDAISGDIVAWERAGVPVLDTSYNLWVAAVQAATGLPRAVAMLYSTVYGRDQLAYVQITWPLALTAGPLDNLGHVHELTGALATRYAGFGWDTAAKVEQTFDAVAGTVAIKYLLWK